MISVLNSEGSQSCGHLVKFKGTHFTSLKNLIFQYVCLELRNARLDLETVNFHCDSTQIINGRSGIIPVVTVNGSMEIYTLIWG